MAFQIPFETYNGHFINNTVKVPSNGACLLIESFDRFKEYFGTAPIMGPSKCVTENLFDKHRILAVLKDYLGNSAVHSVICEGHRLEMTYSIDRIETPGWVAHTPIIVSIPKGFIGFPRCTDFYFLRQEGMFSIDSAENETADANSDKTTFGGWSDYRPVDDAALDIFKVMEGIQGVRYEPVLYKSQVVAGLRYRFICLSKGVYPGATWGMAIVSLFRPPAGDVVVSEIKAIPVPDIDDPESLIARIKSGKEEIA